ncbi:hypothetical protein K439DRAFT_1619572 [Ramaria rubella]|nr:hypothetical protein K439DRAFT_1619572 [Ramaria rubella]
MPSVQISSHMGSKWSQSAIRKCGVRQKQNINVPDDSPSKSTRGAAKKCALVTTEVGVEVPSPKRPKTCSQARLPDIEEVEEEGAIDKMNDSDYVPPDLDASAISNNALSLESEFHSDLSEPEILVDKKGRGRPKGTMVKAKEVGGKKAELDIEPFTELAFFVPLGSSKGQGHVAMLMSTSHELALQQIYKAMESDRFHNKPPLTYTMKGTGRVGVCLKDEKDWAGLKVHVRAVCKMEHLININLQGDPDYMATIQARLGSTNSNKRNGKKTAGKTIDLDGEVAIAPDEEAQLRQREKDELAILKRKHKGCPRCSEEVYCKVNKHNSHVALTHQQLTGWASSIVRFD